MVSNGIVLALAFQHCNQHPPQPSYPMQILSLLQIPLIHRSTPTALLRLPNGTTDPVFDDQKLALGAMHHRRDLLCDKALNISMRTQSVAKANQVGVQAII